MAQEYFLGEQTVPLCADTQYAGVLGVATPMRVTFERPGLVSVVLHGDTLEWISTPRSRPSAQARHSEKT